MVTLLNKNITLIGASCFVGTRLIGQLGKDICHNLDVIKLKYLNLRK
jgi:hypothetical protein